LRKIAIIHFQPLEKYPPVMNFINSIAVEEDLSCVVHSTDNKGGNWFDAKKINIKRVTKQYQNPLLRYWCYIKFNVSAFCRLVFKQPAIVIAFETYSVLPVFLYKFFFKKKMILVHYHEYTSLIEIKTGSLYTKFLNKIEKKMYAMCNYISHTNKERKNFFLNDYPFVDANKMFISPNFPPSNWYEFAKLHKKKNETGVIKLVHVGAISLDTMYTKKIVDWVLSQNGKYSIDFYSNNITTDAKLFLKATDNNYVKLYSEINYYQLPSTLINYDIGLTLYNGHIPNYIYNIPNKVLEYLACGLQVCYSSELISTQNFINDFSIKGCYKLNFNNSIEAQINFESIKFNYNSSYYNLLKNPSPLLLKIASHS
jgi:hypothetical protein